MLVFEGEQSIRRGCRKEILSEIEPVAVGVAMKDAALECQKEVVRERETEFGCSVAQYSVYRKSAWILNVWLCCLFRCALD